MNNLIMMAGQLLLVEVQKISILNKKLRPLRTFICKSAEYFISCALSKSHLVAVEFNMKIVIFERGNKRLIHNQAFFETEVEKGIFIFGNNIFLPSCKFFGRLIHLKFSRRKIFKEEINIIKSIKFTEAELIERNYYFYLVDKLVLYGNNNQSILKKLNILF